MRRATVSSGCDFGVDLLRGGGRVRVCCVEKRFTFKIFILTPGYMRSQTPRNKKDTVKV